MNGEMGEMKPMVLVVEDSDDDFFAIQRKLGKEGVIAIQAATEDAARRALEDHASDWKVVLMDGRLTGYDGHPEPDTICLLYRFTNDPDFSGTIIGISSVPDLNRQLLETGCCRGAVVKGELTDPSLPIPDLLRALLPDTAAIAA